MIISINLKELPIEVEYKYIPEERCIRYDEDLGGYPGYPAQVFLGNIFHNKENINKFIDEMDWWDYIEELVLEEINKSREE